MNFIGTKIINLNRIVLTKFYCYDYLDFNEYASIEEVTRYLTWYKHASIEESKEILNNKFSKYDSSTFRWAIRYKENNKLIGSIDVVRLDKNSESVEIGYVLNPKYQNKGIMKEALKGVSNYLFNQVLINKIYIRCIKENIASYKVMKACGYITIPYFKSENIKGKEVLMINTYLDRFTYNYLLDERYKK